MTERFRVGVLLAVLTLGCRHSLAQDKQPTAERLTAAVATADKALADRAELTARLCDAVWKFAEPAFQERQSAKLLADTLTEAGFTVRRGVAEMPAAFVAEFRHGTGGPSLALLVEYDALPGLSQKVGPTKEPLESGRSGHGCGHNLLGVASVMAGLALRDAMVAHNIAGRVVVYGCPAEEGGGGKVYLARAGEFAGIDACLTWHPGGSNTVNVGGCLAVIRVRFRFHGQAAHAAGNPERGRSALDAVELTNVGVNFLREHVPEKTRIHYVITDGGSRPNIVPETAEVWYYVRAPKMEQARAAFERVQDCARGAAIMTRTELTTYDVSGTYDVVPNRVLSAVMYRQLQRVGAPAFDAKDFAFAKAIRQSLGLGTPGEPNSAALATTVDDINSERMMGSTDVGDVSRLLPTAELRMAANVRGGPGHSWNFVAAAGSPIGHKSAHAAARVLASSALELLTEPALLRAASEEFSQTLKAADYKPVLPPGKPPETIDVKP